MLNLGRDGVEEDAGDEAPASTLAFGSADVSAGDEGVDSAIVCC